MTTRTVVNTEEKWHELRNKYITASEAAVLLGHNPYSSPSKLKKDNGFVGNAYTFIGQVLEPVVVDITNRILLSKFRLYETENEGKVFYTKGSLGATPDATDGSMLLECKSTKPDTYLKYKEAPPFQYLIQLQVQLHCTDMKEGYLSILSTDLSQTSQNIVWPIVIYKVKRNDKLCAIIQSEAERFFRDSTYRVNSAIKKQTGAILSLCHEKVYESVTKEVTPQKTHCLTELRALMQNIK